MNENSVDLDALSGVPSEKVFDKLLSDATFVDYFNTFLSLPVFGKKLSYNREDDNFNIDPPPPRTCYHVPKHRVKKWVRKERIQFFWKTDLFLEYTLCVKLHNASDHSNTTVDSDEVRNFLGTVEDMHKFLIFLRGTAGHRILIFWIDAERYRRVTKKEHRRFAFREIQAKYLLSGSPRELPEIIKWTSLCGGTPHPCRTSSFKLPKSITKRMYLSDSSIFSENVFIPGQKMALERLSSYWVPKYIQHKKIIKKRIAEKRGVHCELRAETVSLKPVPEVDNPVFKTRFEKDVDDFMDAHHVSSTESMSEEEMRAQQLEEWKRWFWEGVDSQTGSEPKVEPPKDMPPELRLLGGIRGEDETAAPPSSPVPLVEESTPLNAIAESEEEEEEEQLSSSESQEIINGRIYSASFSHPERVGIVSPPTERSQSLPGLSSFDLTYWRKKKPKKEEPEVDTEYSEPEEVIDPMFLPRLIPRYAKTPSSSPRKLKTFYEALASERSTSSGNYSESSSESPSPKSSSSVSPQPTVIVALERSSASRIVPLKDVRQEITAAVNEPRAAYPRETPLGEKFILPIGDKDVPTSSDHVHNPPVAVALTADKLAGGPLREYLEKTQENMALRCLQFCEDVQRYLSPPENFGSYSKYHSAKTLIATYIAPDSPREMPLSPQIRADLMRHLPQESGNSLLSSVVKASVKAVASPWSEFVRSDEEHFVNSVGIRRKNVKKLQDVESEKGAERTGNKIWQAFKLAVSVGMSGFSFGQDDEDKDEREAREDGFRIPGYKQKKEEVDPRKRRPSHFYGHMSKQGDEGSDANKGILTTKIRPPKPRCFNDVLHDTLQLMWFRRFLSEKNCEAPLLFWQAVENMKTNCKDGKARQARAMIITKKYFINISVPAVEYLHCKADIIKDIPLLDKTTPPLLVSAQACVARSMEENWYTEYVATFPDDESERENFQKYAMRNTLAGVYRMAAHGKTKGLWAVFAHHIMCFQRGITHPDSLREFKQFLKKESKATVEQNIRRHAVNPTRRMINNQFVNTDRLISDLEFWMEVQRFKDQADYATECARLGNYTLEDEHLLLDKAKTIVKCYIDSDVPPRVQINTANDLAENIVGLVSSGIVERGLFHEAALSVFSHLMFFWKKFSAEKINKPPEEPKPPVPSKRGSSRKRVMSMVGGMPYRKLYVAQDEELHWSYTLSHGLRLNMPLRLVIAKRVATQMENPTTDNRPSAVSLPRPTH